MFPDKIISEVTAVGAMSLGDREVALWGIHVGIPERRLTNKSQKILNLDDFTLKHCEVNY